MFSSLSHFFKSAPDKVETKKTETKTEDKELIKDKIDTIINSAQNLAVDLVDFLKFLSVSDFTNNENNNQKIEEQTEEHKTNEQNVEEKDSKEKNVDLEAIGKVVDQVQNILNQVQRSRVVKAIDAIIKEDKEHLQQAIISLFENHSPTDIFSIGEDNVKRIKNFISVLTCSFTWPNENVTIEIPKQNIEKLKIVLFNTICSFANDDDKDETLKMNALLQSLCCQTFLGRIFYIKRGYFEPSLSSGSLYGVATQINKILVSKQEKGKDIYDDTDKALISQYTDNEHFKSQVGSFFCVEQLILSSPHYNEERQLFKI